MSETNSEREALSELECSFERWAKQHFGWPADDFAVTPSDMPYAGSYELRHVGEAFAAYRAGRAHSAGKLREEMFSDDGYTPPAAPADEVGRMVSIGQMWYERDLEMTHYEGCEREHYGCFAHKAVALIESLAAERDRLREERDAQNASKLRWMQEYEREEKESEWQSDRADKAESDLAAANATIARLERELNATARRRAEEIKQQKPRKL